MERDRFTAGLSPLVPTHLRGERTFGRSALRPTEQLVVQWRLNKIRFIWTKDRPMTEIILLVEEAAEGGYTARALGHSIFTESETLEELRHNIREAVACHFDDGAGPGVIRLHFVRDEVLTP